MNLQSALELPVPRNLTTLLQHLQRLVGREGHRHWCGGTIPVTKLSAFVHKMETRYPLLRNTRERSYDRRRGRAVVHMIVYPMGSTAREPSVVATPDGIARPPVESTVAWWLVSGVGTGGLSDPTMPDTHICKDAMSASGHIVVTDYVLAYFTKKEPREIIDRDSGRTRSVFKDTSTWTWKIRSEIVSQARAAIGECCSRFEYGAEHDSDGPGRGLLGFLEAQRSRPLFAGVRSQVIDLHRYARDAWDARRGAWNAKHQRHGKFRPLSVDINRFPRMLRIPVYDKPPRRVQDLIDGA